MKYLGPIDAKKAGQLFVPAYTDFNSLPAAALNEGAIAYTLAEKVYQISDGESWYRIVRTGSRPYINLTSSTPLNTTNELVECQGTFTVTLPTAVNVENKEYIIKNTGVGLITLDTTSGQFIDGQLTQNIAAGDAITIRSNGVGWLII